MTIKNWIGLGMLVLFAVLIFAAMVFSAGFIKTLLIVIGAVATTWFIITAVNLLTD